MMARSQRWVWRWAGDAFGDAFGDRFGWGSVIGLGDALEMRWRWDWGSGWNRLFGSERSSATMMARSQKWVRDGSEMGLEVGLEIGAGWVMCSKWVGDRCGMGRRRVWGRFQERSV
eukprot:2658633-Rhodomonas_salina.1